MLRCLWLSLAIGCTFDHGFAGQSPNPETDGSVQPMQDGSTVVTPDARQCFSVPEVSVNICLSAPLSGTLTISSNTTIDTDSTGSGATQCKALQVGSSDVCVIAALKITINGSRTLSAHGTRPLVLLA